MVLVFFEYTGGAKAIPFNFTIVSPTFDSIYNVSIYGFVLTGLKVIITLKESTYGLIENEVVSTVIDASDVVIFVISNVSQPVL